MLIRAMCILNRHSLVQKMFQPLRIWIFAARRKNRHLTNLNCSEDEVVESGSNYRYWSCLIKIYVAETSLFHCIHLLKYVFTVFRRQKAKLVKRNLWVLRGLKVMKVSALVYEEVAGRKRASKWNQLNARRDLDEKGYKKNMRVRREFSSFTLLFDNIAMFRWYFGIQYRLWGWCTKEKEGDLGFLKPEISDRVQMLSYWELIAGSSMPNHTSDCHTKLFRQLFCLVLNTTP